MGHVVIVDYGMCNLDSIARAVEECGGNPVVTDNPRELKEATQIILPGVGSFGDAMNNIRERGLEDVLIEEVQEHKIPFLGICLGMQMMARAGFENGDTRGLGWIDGEVRKLTPAGEDTRIPHIGWNEVYPQAASPLFAGIDPGRDFYFVHSYHLVCSNKDQVLATTPYAGEFVAAVGYDHIFGTQFHPEKSQRAGFQVLKNFLEY